MPATATGTRHQFTPATAPLAPGDARRAVVWCIVAYLVAHGLGVASSILTLTGVPDTPPTDRASVFTGLATQASLQSIGLVFALFALRHAKVPFRTLFLGQQPRPRWSAVSSFGWFWTSTGVGIIAYYLLTLAAPQIATPHTDTPTLLTEPAVVLIRSVMAGVFEETLVLATPLLIVAVLARRANPVPPLLIVAVLVAARMGYHLYYGWGALQLLPWAIAMVFVYWRFRATWPLIVAHIVYDVAVAAAQDWHLFPIDVFVYTLTGVGVALVIVGALGRRRTTAPRRAANPNPPTFPALESDPT